MSNRTHDVTFSTGLLEKLAGLRKKEPPKPMIPRPAIHLPTRTPISPDAARLLAQDKQLTRHLQATKEVAGLLVKAEEAELAQIQAKAQAMLEKYSVPAKPPPCQAEAEACTQCFRENAEAAWQCSKAAEAYRLCSVKALAGAAASVSAARG